MRLEIKHLSVDSISSPNKYGVVTGGRNVPDRIPSRHGRTRTHRLTRGLFILRYVASNAPSGSSTQRNIAPAVRVAPQNAAEVELIAWPDASSHELRAPGDGLVIRALRDTTITFEVMPAYEGGSIDAELQLEPVSRLAHAGFNRAEANAAPNVTRASATTVQDIDVLAHVARRGDVVIPAGEWICGPDYPMAIEGLEIRWPRRPAGLEIVTTVSVSKNGIRHLPASLTGEFAGTRGRAAPIASLEISLTGERAKEFTLRADALFLGASVQSRSGRSVSLTGPTGREPLVGLRLSVVTQEVHDSSRGEPRARMQEPARAGSNWSSAGRIRVFRGLKKGTSESPALIRERV